MERQIDYIVLDGQLFKWTTDAEANDMLDLGSDHRCVRAVLKIPRKRKPFKDKITCIRKRKRSKMGWVPKDVNEYSDRLGAELRKVPHHCVESPAATLQIRCKAIEKAINEAAEHCKLEEEAMETERLHLDGKLQELLQSRRAMRTRGAGRDKAALAQVSKDIQKLLRKARREKGREVIGRLLEDFKDLKRVAGIRNSGKKHHLTTMRNSLGETVDDKQSLADVFADFYEKLYATRRPRYTDGGWSTMACEKVHLITPVEIEEQLHKMAKRKAGDQAGIVAEMLQLGGRHLHACSAEVSNDILDPESEPPVYWKETRLKVLYEKGDHAEASNYRPIAMLPIPYKLFTKII